MRKFCRESSEQHFHIEKIAGAVVFLHLVGLKPGNLRVWAAIAKY
jgi:hypothetical protein